jgi:uncharacterized membrane protein YdcZ (DUF606 family)
LFPFCFYVFKADDNVCANASNLMFFSWNMKIVFAIITDIFRPFGLRRKPWMLMGWAGVLLLLLVLALFADQMEPSTW